MSDAVTTPRAGLFELIFGRGKAETSAPAAANPEAASLIQDGASLFKALGHEGRLMILCHLVGGEKSVNELEAILDARQSAVSQQLARLRMEGMVAARREGQMIFYSIRDPRVPKLLQALDDVLVTESPGHDAIAARDSNGDGRDPRQA